MSGGVWKAVETGAREVGIGEAKGRGSKRGSREEEKEKPEEGEDGRS